MKSEKAGDNSTMKSDIMTSEVTRSYSVLSHGHSVIRCIMFSSCLIFTQVCSVVDT